MRAYIAGRYTARFRLRPIRERIRALGIDCRSAWIDNEDGDYPVPRERAIVEARRALAEVGAADIIMLDTLDESMTGGREVELGIHLGVALALADPASPPRVILVGPVCNIFHELADMRCPSWSEALEALADLAAKNSC